MMANYSRDTEFTNLFSILALLRAVNIWRGKKNLMFSRIYRRIANPFLSLESFHRFQVTFALLPCTIRLCNTFFLFLVMFDALMAVEIDRGLKYL